ncbi:acetate--CoA ligase family protein [Conexibacter sp. S30A1]|uniref:acetate--CoA ligase family protein n=1 Tax=Conexibacter sp. S30A1 TaxID=2937800 RepID=UPI00200D4F2A|nr:acetate--CoA ligase family protein [Conexibacter sp. S30A1]
MGASSEPERVGTRALRNLPHFGYEGRVYPVNPRAEELLGYACYRSVADVPDPVDLAVICVASERVPGALRECGARGIPAAVVFASGFGPGTAESQRLQSELTAAHRASGVRVLGPNTIGTRLVQTGVFATFAHDVEGGVTPGSVAIIAQSGGLGVYFGSAFLRRYGVGTRYLVDTGNELDVSAAEVLEYVAEDDEVSSIGLILEGARDGRRLMRAVAVAVAAGKPVVFLKTGRSEAASAQVVSHTGAVAGNAELFDRALTTAGAHVARDESEFVDALRIFDAGVAPKGRRIGAVTPSGGYAILTIDAADRYGLGLPHPAIPPTPEQESALASGALTNPFDYTSISAAGPETLGAAIAWISGQPNVDAVLVWQAYSLIQAERRAQFEEAIVAASPSRMPIFGCGITSPEFEARLRELGVLWFEEPTRLVRALSVAAPSPKSEPWLRPGPTTGRGAGAVVVGEAARRLLTGIEHAEAFPVFHPQAAVSVAERLGPVMLKVESGTHAHKTEVGLVEGPLDAAHVAQAYAALVDARARAGADDSPVVVQAFESGVELALGGYQDPVFGASVMVAAGGIYLEVLRDIAVAVAPVSEAQARELILSLRMSPLLLGARGRPPADLDAAARALVALSEFMADASGRWSSVDINPLIVRDTGQGAVAVDVLLVPNNRGEDDEPA